MLLLGGLLTLLLLLLLLVVVGVVRRMVGSEPVAVVACCQALLSLLLLLVVVLVAGAAAADFGGSWQRLLNVRTVVLQDLQMHDAWAAARWLLMLLGVLADPHWTCAVEQPGSYLEQKGVKLGAEPDLLL